ncbi:hypothetical protein ACYPKM_01305 [Pseudomonas aeruginosa]
MKYDNQTLEGIVGAACERHSYLKVELPQWVQKSLAGGDDPGRLFMRSIMDGNVGEAYLLWAEHGPFALSISWTARTGFKVSGFADGSEMDVRKDDFERKYNTSPNSGYVALVLMEAAGLFEGKSKKAVQRLIGPKDNYHSGMTYSSLVEGLIPDDIPVIGGLRIENPELYLAVRAESSRPVGQVVDSILCWVDEGDYAAYSDVYRRFDVHQAVELGSRPNTQTPCADLKSGMAPEADSVCSFDFRITVADGKPTTEDMRAIHVSCPQLTAYGLSTKPGHVLCSVPLSFLETMGHAFPDAQKLARVTEDVRARIFVSTRQLACVKGNLSHIDPGKEGAVRSTLEFWRMLKLLPGAAENVRGIIPRQLLQAFVVAEQTNSGLPKLHQGEYHLVKEQLGLSTADLKISLDQKSVQALHDAGNKFDPGTDVTLWISSGVADTREDEYTMAEEAMRQYLDMSDAQGTVCGVDLTWPPAKQLERISRLEDDIGDKFTAKFVLKHLLHYRGVEYFADHATSLKQWRGMAVGFGVNGLKPVWDRVPREIRVKQMGKGMSL